MNDVQPEFDLNQAIIEKLKDIRMNKKLTQKDFAKLILVSPSVYSRLESGKKELTLNFIQKVSEKTNTDINEIFSFSGHTYFGNSQKGLQNQCSSPTLHINLDQAQFELLKDILE